MPETNTPQPDNQDYPAIRPPEPIKPYVDSAKPERGEWWQGLGKKNKFLNPELGLMTEPPQTTKEFDSWLMQTLHDHEKALVDKQSEQAEIQAWELNKSKVHPTVAKQILSNAGLKVQNWYRLEADPNVTEADKNKAYGAYSGVLTVASELGVGADVGLIEEIYKRVPTVNAEVMNARRAVFDESRKRD